MLTAMITTLLIILSIHMLLSKVYIADYNIDAKRTTVTSVRIGTRKKITGTVSAIYLFAINKA